MSKRNWYILVASIYYSIDAPKSVKFMANELIVNHATLAINTNFMLISLFCLYANKDTTKKLKTQTSLFLVEVNTKKMVYECKWMPWFINNNKQEK